MGLEASVRDLLTSLKAISDLQNPAVKARHWASLIEATKRKTTTGKEEKLLTINFVNDSETTRGDLLALQLDRYEEGVRSVVDRAVRKIYMEKKLRELEATWANLELDKEMHNRTRLTLLKASDDLIAILEDSDCFHFAEFVSIFIQKRMSHIFRCKNSNGSYFFYVIVGSTANSGHIQVRCSFDERRSGLAMPPGLGRFGACFVVRSTTFLVSFGIHFRRFRFDENGDANDACKVENDYKKKLKD
jgi:Dynein heavy chain, N-terminal region 2